MKRTNAITLLIIAIVIIVIGGGLYWAQKTGRISLFAAFEGWSDVTPNDPAYTEMMTVGERGWMQGYEDGTLQPDWDVDRASVVVAEVRAREDTVLHSNCKIGDPLTWPAPDVDCNHWAFDYIVSALSSRIINLYPDGSFRPDDIATRAEAVVFIVKAKEWPVTPTICDQNDPSTWTFPDVPCDHLARNYISVAKEKGLIFGYPDGNFHPDDNATRRDLAVLLYRGWVQAGREISIKGVVNDATTSKTIPGASIVVTSNQFEGTKLSDVSDSTGAYQLRVVMTGGSTSVMASADGYQSQTQGVNLDGDTTLNFSLSPVSQQEGVISGSVKNADSGKAIVGASITILNYENGSQLTDISDSSGLFRLKVAATTGTFSIKASASNYQSKTLAATLSGGTATLNFSLDPVVDNPGGPDEPGQPPIVVAGGGGNVSAATTGATLPVVMVLLGSVLALFSLVYLLKTNKSEEAPQA